MLLVLLIKFQHVNLDKKKLTSFSRLSLFASAMPKGGKTPEFVAQQILDYRPIVVTGCEHGSKLQGFRGNAARGELQIGFPGGARQMLGPSLGFLQEFVFNQSPDFQSTFYEKLKKEIARFRNLDHQAISQHLLQTSISKPKQYDLDVLGPQTTVKFFSLPPKLTEIFNDQVQDYLLKNTVTFGQLRQLISDANKGKQVLTFMAKWWQVATQLDLSPQTFQGWIIDLSGAPVISMPNSVAILGQKVYFLDKLKYQHNGQEFQQIGFQVGQEGEIVDYDLLERFGSAEPATTVEQLVKKILQSLPPSALKSLLQKIIRFGPVKVKVSTKGDEISAPRLLSLICLTLARHPGAFNPTIGSHSRGIESLLKRLAIIAVEDSAPKSAHSVAHLLWGAYLAKRESKWNPSTAYLTWVLQFAQEIYENGQRFDYRTEAGHQYSIPALSPTLKPIEQACLLLTGDFLGSMSGDLLMFRDLALNAKDRFVATSKSGPGGLGHLSRPEVMDIWHCVDQHWAPKIAYLTEKAIVLGDGTAVSSLKPFAPFFGKLFTNLTGLNFRRHQINAYLDREDVKKMQKGQLTYWILYRKTLQSWQQFYKKECEMALDNDTDSQPATYTAKYTLHPSWLSGLVGEIPTSKLDIIACLQIDQLTKIVPIRKLPENFRGSREDAIRATEITAEVEHEVIEEVKARLRHGIGLRQDLLPNPQLANKTVYLLDYTDQDGVKKEDYYLVDRNRLDSSGNLYVTEADQWSNPGSRTIEDVFPIFKEGSIPSGYSIYNGHCWGVAEEADQKLTGFFQTYPTPVKQYLMRHLNTFGSEIELPKIMRDGSGETEALDLYLVYLNEALCYLSALYPGIIGPIGIAKFHIFNLTAYQHLVGIIRALFTSSQTPEATREGQVNWVHQYEDQMMVGSNRRMPMSNQRSNRRMPMSHQVDVLERMKTSHENGIRGHFLWMPVGTGKSYCALSYLKYLKGELHLPPYVIYSLPRSALKTVLQEIWIYNVQVNFLDPTSTGTLATEVNQFFHQWYASHSGNVSPQLTYLTINLGSNLTLLPYTINLIEHDHVRLVPELLRSKISQSVLIVDEVHKALPNRGKTTLRTENLLGLARLSQEFLGMTGTAIINNDIYQLLPWMRLIVPYTLEKSNYFTSLTGMISKKVNTGHIVHPSELKVTFDLWSSDKREEYLALLPSRLTQDSLLELGSDHADDSLTTSSSSTSMANFSKALGICYGVLNPFLVQQVFYYLENQQRVMLISLNSKHSDELAELLLTTDRSEGRDRLNSNEILVLGKPGSQPVDYLHSVNLTPANVASGVVKPYQVVIVPKDRAEGYSLTYLTVMVRAPYPSNQAKREQLEGRINRLEPEPKHLYYVTLYTGILELLLMKYQSAANIQEFLRQLAGDITPSAKRSGSSIPAPETPSL